MRLFVAINLPDPVREQVVRATARLREAAAPVRWVEPEAFHLTLKFLGGVPDSGLEPVREAVIAVAARHRRFPLELQGAGAFPDPRRPAVWWIGVQGSTGLEVLRQDVERTLAPLGFPTEPRPYSPHLTLGRTRRDARPVRDAERLLQDVVIQSTFTVGTLDLMRSHLSPRGARYERTLAAALAQ